MERHQGVGGRLEPRLLTWGKTPAAIGILCSPQEIEARGERFAHLQFQEVDHHLGGQSALFRYFFRIRASHVERPSRRQRRLSSRRGRAPARKHARSKAVIAGWKPAPPTVY